MSEPRDPTHELAAVLSGLRLEDVAPPARAYATDLLLDALVCALAADHAEDTAPFDVFANALGGEGSSTVIGVAERRAMTSAALLNGFRITAVTACDVYAPAEMHTMPAALPPALAIAERDGASGAALLTAVIAGLETAVRLARSFDRDAYKGRGWHSPGVIGPFAGAAAAASVLGLDADGMRNALALAGSQAAGTWAARGTPTVKFHQARAAHAGLMSGLLAGEGFEAAREIMTAPEGGIYVAYADGDGERVLAGLGSDWALEDISLRLWPGGARVQPSIAATSQAVAGSLPAWEEIKRVTVRVEPSVAKAQAWAARPETTFAALASIPFTVALTLRYGSAAPSKFGADGYGDPRILDFITNRVEVIGDPAVPVKGAAVIVATTDGTVREGSVDVPRGDPKSRATRDELAAKAHLFGDDRIGSESVDELIGRVRAIELEPNLDAVLGLVRGVPAARGR
ncbi:MAG TPA: MmgE/PrpD family protein [Candidatus Limnocylindrales bacterium]|nr:MmgE/PrpD family protein [Candidatus Limnocylindrales bacterium]